MLFVKYSCPHSFTNIVSFIKMKKDCYLFFKIYTKKVEYDIFYSCSEDPSVFFLKNAMKERIKLNEQQNSILKIKAKLCLQKIPKKKYLCRNCSSVYRGANVFFT